MSSNTANTSAPIHHHPSFEDWLNDPCHFFSSFFLTFHPFCDEDLEEGSQKVYSAMFGKFTTWLTDNKINLATCTRDDLCAFVEQVSERQHRRRYIRLLGDVFHELAQVGRPGNNPAREAKELVKGFNDPKLFLNQAQQDLVIRHIEESQYKEKRIKELHGFRNAAIIGMFFGTGARVKDFGVFTVNCINRDSEWMVVEKGKYEALVLPCARGILQAWAAARDGQETLFDPINASSLFRVVKAFMLRVGIGDEEDGARLGPQTLRNTYAGILIDKGFNNLQLKMALGMDRIVSAANLRTEYSHFKKGESGNRRGKSKFVGRKKSADSQD